MAQKWNLACFLLIQSLSASLAVSCFDTLKVGNSRMIVQSDAAGTKLTYKCMTGRLFGNRVLSCNASGHWDSPPPVCRELCDAPKKIQNAHLRYPHSEATVKFVAKYKAWYDCEAGFVNMSGVAFATCRHDFTWEDATLICARPSPLQPNTEEHLISQPSPEVLSSLVPSATHLVSQSGVDPTCPPLKLHNGTITSELKDRYAPGDKVTFQCLPGFQPQGKQTITCRREESWVPALHTCVKMEFTYCGIKLEEWKVALENEKRCLEEQTSNLEQNKQRCSET